MSSVGITEFLTQSTHIGGSLKQTPSDFVVQEIDLSNTITTLTNEVFIDSTPEPPISLELSQTSIESLEKLVGVDLCNQLISLSQQLQAGSKESILEIPMQEDKQQRTQFHLAIKAHAPMFTTSTDVNSKTIKIYSSKVAESFNKRQKLGLDSRGAKARPAKFVKFVLKKENVDTMKALKEIGKAAGINDKCFGVAGNKDKKAITTQNVTVFANYLEKLKSARLSPNISIGNFKYSDDELKIGDLSGNHFEIVIRNPVPTSQSSLASLFSSLDSKGFINYFGLQRFGNSSENATHLIGLSILKKDYSSAVDLILAPRPVRNPDEQVARENWAKYKDVERSLQEFPKFCVRFKQAIEKSVLTGMKNAGGNTAYLNGIMNLPRNSRMLYGHAYQSYIWNQVVSERIRMSSDACKPYLVPGDLIQDSQGHVAYLTEENCGRYKLSDVVLPLPGSKIITPKNQAGEVYERALSKDGMSFEVFGAMQKELALTGSYRKIVVRPEGIHWEAIEAEGVLTGVKVVFNLPPSSYATICLREVIGEEIITD